MKPLDKKVKEDVKEDRDLENREPDLGELDEDPSEL